MTDAIIGAVLAAIIAGVFDLVGKRLELSHQRASANLPESHQVSIKTGSNDLNINANSVDFGTVLRHIGLLQLSIQLVGFFIGILLGILGARDETIIVAIVLLGTLVLIIGFLMSGWAVDPLIRWNHLAYVAAGTWFTSFTINVLLGVPINGVGFVISIGQILMAALLGGVLSNTIKRV